jgi:subtilisin family serine protease
MTRRLLLAALFASAAAAQDVTTRPTTCQMEDVVAAGEYVDRRFVACAEGLPGNLLWHLDRADSVVGALDGHFLQRTTGKSAVVYVMDTSVWKHHDEFARATGSVVIAGFDPTNLNTPCSDNRALDPCWNGEASSLPPLTHGTAVASLIAGKTVGVAPDAKLVAIRATGGTDRQWRDALLAIITHAHDPASPAFRTGIVNISGGIALADENGAAKSPLFEALMRKMIAGVDRTGNADPNGKRFLFVVAAGNHNEDAALDQCQADGGVRIFPSTLARSIDGMVSVGGIDESNRFTSRSCRGPLVEVAAPATNIVSASISGPDRFRGTPEYFLSGTSYSTPIISGMAARLLEIDPELSPAELEARLKSSPSVVDGVAVPVLPVVTRRRASR